MIKKIAFAFLILFLLTGCQQKVNPNKPMTVNDCRNAGAMPIPNINDEAECPTNSQQIGEITEGKTQAICCMMNK